MLKFKVLNLTAANAKFETSLILFKGNKVQYITIHMIYQALLLKNQK